MKFCARYALLILILVPSVLPAQKEWTLEECIEYAQANNIQLRMEEIAIDLQTNKVQQAKFDLLPQLNIRSSHTNRFGRSVDPLTYQFTNEASRGASFSAYSGVDLFRGFRGVNTVKKDQLDLKMTLENLEQAKYDLTLNVTRYYLEILYFAELKQTAYQQTEITRQQLARTKRLVDAGSLPSGSLLEIEANLADEELAVVQADNEFNLAILHLAQLLELEDPESFRIVKQIPDTLPGVLNLLPESEILAGSLEWMPRIKSAGLGVQSAEKNLQIQQGWLLPTLSLTSGWGTGYSNQITDLLSGNLMPFRDQLKYSSSTYFSFSLDIPVFNGLSAQYKVKDARLGVEKSLLFLEAQKNQLEKEIRIARADAVAAFHTYQASEKSLLSLEKAFSDTQKRFDLGMLTALEYNTAKNKLTQARSEQLRAKYVFLFNQKILNFYSK